MPGRVCSLADSNCSEALKAKVRQLLDLAGTWKDVTLPQLRAIGARPGAELGALILPFDGSTDLTDLSEALTGLRFGGVHLRVLGLTDDEELAARLPLGDVFDDIAVCSWRSCPERILRFLRLGQLERHDRAFRSFLDTAEDGYWIWDIPTDRVEWSERTRMMSGLPEAEVPHSLGAFIDAIHPEDRASVGAAIEAHFEQGKPYRDIAFRMRNAQGGYGTYVANGQALRDETGKPILLVGSLTDQGPLARVEQTLEDTRRRFHVLFHRMNDGAVLADVETGLILEANEPAERLWGRPISEIVGSHQSSLHPPTLDAEARKAFADHIAALMRDNRASIQVPILRADGTEVPTEISSSLIEIGGRMTILGVFRDITERERAEQEIRARDSQIQMSSHLASMGTLAAGVAHEINNPLTYLLGNLEFLREYLGDQPEIGPEVIEALDSAATGASFLREIVTDLKAISRMDTAEATCEPADVVRVATRMVMSDLRHRATLDLTLDDVPRVPMSPARLTQVVLNLLTNALRSFAGSDRRQNRVGVSVTSRAGGMELRISDTGVGIPAEDLRRVGEPFFTRRQGRGGTGLGLAICRRLLSEAGGTLQITSEPGKGTTVTVWLPSTDARAAEPAAALAAVGAGRRARIMVLDDDVLVSRLIEQVMRRDYDVRVFNDPVAAVQALAEPGAFDIVLCDLMMPEMTGREVYDAACARPGCPPFLFITGGGVTEECIETEREMLRRGRLIFKPFETADLRARVAAILDAAAAARPAPDVATDGGDQPTARQTGRAPADRAREAGTAADRPSPAMRNPGMSVVDEIEAMLGPEQLTRQMRRLLDDVTSAEEGMWAALQNGTLEPAVMAAHKCAGGAGLLGQETLTHCLWAIEVAGREGDTTALRNRLHDLERERAALAALVSAREARQSAQLT